MSFIRENFTDSQEKLKLDNINSPSTLALKQTANLSHFFSKFNHTTEIDTSKYPDNAVECRYYDL